MTEIILTVVVIILVSGGIFLLLKKQPKLSANDFQIYKKKIEATKKLDPAHGIMESHKIFVTAIGQLFLGETSARKITKAIKFFPNTSQIWKFHGLRNKIAHETDFQVSFAQAENCRYEFIRALSAISNKK